MKAEISGVIQGSIVEELGVEKGDLLVSINGVSPKDLIDYRYLTSEEYVEIEIEKSNHGSVILEIEKDEDEDIGLIFDLDIFDGMKRCKNNCIFCFVDQMPPGLRNTLYLKDDDYRLSFLYGNFITLTNISQKDISRILDMHISPIYISVHSTNALIRQKMLNNSKAGQIVSQLKIFADAGIEMHTQVVLCPGINDQEYLSETINDLAKLWPQVKSIALVPVGITKFQKNHQLRLYTTEEARQILERASQWQQIFKKRFEANLIFLADEFYLMAEEKIPSCIHYEGFPQIENGVGLIRSFWDSFYHASEKLPKVLKQSRKVTFVTGLSGGIVLRPVIDKLNKIINLDIDLIQVSNDFFGSSVTVAGLLTGHDLIVGLKEWRQRKSEDLPEVLISSTMLKFGENIFLDNMTVDQVQRALKIKLNPIEPRGDSLIKAVIAK